MIVIIVHNAIVGKERNRDSRVCLSAFHLNYHRITNFFLEVIRKYYLLTYRGTFCALSKAGMVSVRHQNPKNLKGGKKCQEEMEQDRKARDPEPGEARDKAVPAAVGAEAVLAPGRAATAYVPNAAKKQRINWGRRVMS